MPNKELNSGEGQGKGDLLHSMSSHEKEALQPSSGYRHELLVKIEKEFEAGDERYV
jgi:hypothetical protein